MLHMTPTNVRLIHVCLQQDRHAASVFHLFFKLICRLLCILSDIVPPEESI